jgi:rod shape-determining protein MreC
MLSFIKRHQILLTTIALSLFSLHLVSADTKGRGGEPLIKGAVLVLAYPFQTIASLTYEATSNVWDNYVYLIGLSKENLELHSKIDSLKEENNSLTEELLLSQRLEELIAFKEKTRTKTTAASILSFGSLDSGTTWARVATLNKGRDDGIKKDMPIISRQGIVGRIIETSATTSLALLITDPRSNIGIVIQRNRIRGILEGTGSGLRLVFIRQLEDVKVGDRLVTSGLSGIYPKGIIIGEVSEVSKGQDNFFKKIHVRPSADFSTLEEVLIVTSKAGALSDLEELR